MGIARNQLPGLDVGDVVTGERLSPIHPGEILREEFLIPLGMTAHALAMALQVDQHVMRCINVLVVKNTNRSQFLDWRATDKPGVDFCQLVENLVFSFQPGYFAPLVQHEFLQP